jgi:hypothetical protein
MTGIPNLDLLLLEVLEDDACNVPYVINAEQSAQIVQSLWMCVLPL